MVGFSDEGVWLKKVLIRGKKYIGLDDLDAGDYYVDNTEHSFDESDGKIEMISVDGTDIADCSLVHSSWNTSKNKLHERIGARDFSSPFNMDTGMT